MLDTSTLGASGIFTGGGGGGGGSGVTGLLIGGKGVISFLTGGKDVIGFLIGGSGSDVIGFLIGGKGVTGFLTGDNGSDVTGLLIGGKGILLSIIFFAGNSGFLTGVCICNLGAGGVFFFSSYTFFIVVNSVFNADILCFICSLSPFGIILF